MGAEWSLAFPDPKQPTPPKWVIVDPWDVYLVDGRLPTGNYEIAALGTVAMRPVARGLRKEDAELIVRLVNGT